MRLSILFFLSGLLLGEVTAQTGVGMIPGPDAWVGSGVGFDPPGANDHIFPPSVAAKSFIDFDARGFLMGGKRVFFVSAGMEYARVPRALWQDRLLRLKRAGFNCIEIYTFWNWHEPREGQFDFSGDHDLEAFLRLVQRLGLYAIVRVGPYYCAEWDNGGYPLWLRFKPGVRVREDNAEFEKYVDRFFDKLLPIVSRQQIHHGGAVVLVQLENEHPKGWGTVMPDGYFRHLRDKALSMGLEVPYFFSGLHHATDPAGDLPHRVPGDGPNGAAAAATGGGLPLPGDAAAVGGSPLPGDAASLDDPSRPNPWLSTEFWSVWYNGYSSTDKEAREYERRTWKIIAHGGNGYNYYMAYGGSNFAYTNNDEDAASYDYGAAVGQAGDLRPIYYSFKRMGWWARSFADILENSVDATGTMDAVGKADASGTMDALGTMDAAGTADTAVTVTARHSPAGDLIFLDNHSGSTVSASLPMKQGVRLSGGVKLPSGGSLSLAPGEILPIVHHFVMDAAVTLEWAPVRMLGISSPISMREAATTIVIYGKAGSPAELYFNVRGKATILKGGDGLSIGAAHSVTGTAADPAQEQVTLQTKFSDTKSPVEYSFRAGGKNWRILAVSTQLADRTWFLEAGGKSVVVCGPDYAEDVRVQNGKIVLTAESRRDDSGHYPVWIYEEGMAPVRLKASGGDNFCYLACEGGDTGGRKIKMRLPLTPWQYRSGIAAAAKGYYDNDWKYSTEPLQMGADGDGTADAWYRTHVNIDTAGLYTLQVEGSDRATAFVDGVRAGTGAIRDGEITFNLSKGPHVLAFFMAHDGRDKLAAYLGAMDSVDRKGLFGKAMLRKGGSSIVTVGGWKFLKANAREDGESAAGGFPAAGTTAAAGWKEYAIGEDAFGLKEGCGWFRTTLAEPAVGVSQILLNFKSVDENATVFINGRKIGRHAGWNQPFEVVIGGLDTLQRPLVLTLFLENYSNEGGIDKPVRANYAAPGKEVTGWLMRGGPDGPLAGEWKVLRDASASGKTGPRNMTVPGKTGKPGSRDTSASGKTGKPGSDGIAAGPCFYKSSFMAPAYGVVGAHPIWRVHTEGLGHGSVWVNGHNLGRYPEKTPAPGLYIPECWLKAGANSLVIFDEDGKHPEEVAVQAEKAASRDRVLFSNF